MITNFLFIDYYIGGIVIRIVIKRGKVEGQWKMTRWEFEASGREHEGTGEAQGPLNPGDTVLVADESADVSAVARRMLELLGYGVMTAKNGRQTLEMLGRYRGMISLVILDMMMFRHLDEDTRERLHGVSLDVPVLIWSGYPPEVCLQRILDQGRVDFLQKPFSMNELAGKVRQLLSSC